MKNLLALLVFTLAFSAAAKSQDNKPQLLKEPASWTFERFALPPVFAPQFPYKGAEELRFSPGMFSKDSATYFTYAFVAQLDNTLSFSQDNIQDYLVKYFKGLCSITAKDRKLVIDTTKITVTIEPRKNSLKDKNIYNASLNVFGIFADGAPVKLNMEIKVLSDVATQKTYLVFIASPLEKKELIWQKLYAIQKGFRIP